MILPLAPPEDDPHAACYWRTAEAAPDLPADPAEPLADLEYRQFADMLPTLGWIARADGYIVWYNRRWHAYCGTTPAEMEGWGWQSVHDPSLLPQVMERWQRSIAAGEPFEMVFPLKGADGVFRPFLTRITPCRSLDGRVIRWFGTNTEIGGQLRAEAAARDAEARFQGLAAAMPQMVWTAEPGGHHDYVNARWYDFTGAKPGATDDEGWLELIHPDDRVRAADAWHRSLSTGDPYDLEYRLWHHSGEWRWVVSRALPLRDDRGGIVRWIGTSTEIHEARRAAEQNELLSRELSHRIKNIFAVIGGLLGLSTRRHPEARDFARDLSARIAALGRAHEFARPHSDASRPLIGDTTLQRMLAQLMSPYGGAERIAIAGVDVAVDDRGATPVALLFHELATNSAKYGALSAPEGRIDISIEAAPDGELLIRWREEGGPPIAGEPEMTGFGARLAAMSVEQQMGGTLERRWRPEGLELDVRVRPERLARRGRDRQAAE